MTPFYTDDWLTLYGGDCREVLREMPSDSVDCVVTSPPYWGLRDYGQPGQLGLERTPEEYVANMVEVFREVRRVLKSSGTCWLNLGDSYAHNTEMHPTQRGTNPKMATSARAREIEGTGVAKARGAGLKPKDLVGIPWRVAFALQADGWYLRSDIIWSKPNPMPESVTDRPTKSHEYLFLLTKSARYYFDNEAVREPEKPWNGDEQRGYPSGPQNHLSKRYGTEKALEQAVAGRNIRSVWTIATRPYPGAHFAVFPPELPERCIKAGSSERGVCPECGAPWERVVERIGYGSSRATRGGNPSTSRREVETTGWSPSCVHRTGEPCTCSQMGARIGSWECPHHGTVEPGVMPGHPVPAVILDPFGGSGTVGMVANRLSRRAILIDLNPEYLKQQMKRNAQTPLGLTEGVPA